MIIFEPVVEKKATILLIRSHALYISPAREAITFNEWYATQIVLTRSLLEQAKDVLDENPHHPPPRLVL